jgi:hypothetical protein
MNTAATALATGLALLFSLPGGAIAQEAAAAERARAGALGMLTAQAFKKVPEDLAVFVSPYDDNDLNLKLKADFEAQLTAQGRGRAESKTKASFLLLFEAKVIPAEEVSRAPSLGSAKADLGGVDVNVNVWSSTQDSVLGGRQGARDVESSVFHINAVLRDQVSGTVVWQGDAYHVLSGPETERVARAMIAPLVDKIGQSVAREAFEIE